MCTRVCLCVCIEKVSIFCKSFVLGTCVCVYVCAYLLNDDANTFLTVIDHISISETLFGCCVENGL